MKQLSFLFCSVLLLTAASMAQPNKSCFEIKYLDFFGLEKADSLKWSADNLDRLLETDFTKDEPGQHRKTNFLIPFIMLQLGSFYPPCNTSTDTATFRKLKTLYFKIRQQDAASLNSEPIATQLNTIRQDFYSQAENDTLLPFMSYTLDDGPLYGQPSKYIPPVKKGQSYPTAFGTVYITRYSGKTFVTVYSTEGHHVWTRIYDPQQSPLIEQP